MTSYTCIGSFSEFRIHRDSLNNWIKRGIYVNPNNERPMEMDAYSIYNMSILHPKSFNEQNFIQPLINRLIDEEYFCNHDSWRQNETHLRFSSAALKLFSEIVNIKDSKNINIFSIALKHHLKFQDDIKNGIWFLHDSQENSNKYHDYYLKNTNWGSKETNILVLNTHIETINLLFHIISNHGLFKKLSENDQEFLKQNLLGGVSALQYVIKHEKHSTLYAIDHILRPLYTKNFTSKDNLNWFWKKYFYRFRILLKKKYPIFFHKDGYTEREIGLAGVGLYYHVININDLSKLLINLLREPIEIENKDDLISFLKIKIKRGIDYTCDNKDFYNYLEKRHKGILVELCESILMTLEWNPILPEKWIQKYFKIRKVTNPSPGLKGSDRTFNYATVYSLSLCQQLTSQNIDIFCTKDKILHLINLNKNEIKVLTDSGSKKEISLPGNSFTKHPLKESLFIHPAS